MIDILRSEEAEIESRENNGEDYKMSIQIKVSLNGYIPTKAHQEDAGFDLYTPVDFTVKARGSAVIDTEVCIRIPKGYCGLLVSKSGLNVKHDITSTGLIDSGYQGTIRVKLYNNGDIDYHFKRGEKISQIVILPISTEMFALVEDFGEKTERGTNGFGSSER